MLHYFFGLSSLKFYLIVFIFVMKNRIAMIYSFANDYSEGCHPSILKALNDSNYIQQPGYGEDEYSLNVKSKIRELAKNPYLDVHLITGGTLTNLTVLSSILRPYESVIAASTGHIYTNEAGAIEATGHKVESAPTADGKLRPENIEPFLNKLRGHHAVRTRVVYISNSTELGTVYTRSELVSLHEFCLLNDLILYMDGARLPMALTATGSDLTLKDIAELTDVFYIGGTKCGALIGEAIVITNPVLNSDFKYSLKQRGALSAKGRTLGIQFDQLLHDNLIFKLADHANQMANRLSGLFKQLGYPMLIDSPTNQIFPILPNPVIKKIQKQYEFLIWNAVDADRSVIRFITSWATPKEVIDSFIDYVTTLSR